MLCLAPLVMMGYAMTVQTPWHRTTDVSAQIIEVQSCEAGPGVHAKAAGSGLYGAGAHYGISVSQGPWSLTLQPQAGISYVDRPVQEVPLRTQFEVGAELLVGYQTFRVAVQYWHLSNAGLQRPNVGLDLIALQTGWRF